MSLYAYHILKAASIRSLSISCPHKDKDFRKQCLTIEYTAEIPAWVGNKLYRAAKIPRYHGANCILMKKPGGFCGSERCDCGLHTVHFYEWNSVSKVTIFDRIGERL